MKNTIKTLMVIALVAIIGFSFAACETDFTEEKNEVRVTINLPQKSPARSTTANDLIERTASYILIVSQTIVVGDSEVIVDHPPQIYDVEDGSIGLHTIELTFTEEGLYGFSLTARDAAGVILGSGTAWQILTFGQNTVGIALIPADNIPENPVSVRVQAGQIAGANFYELTIERLPPFVGQAIVYKGQISGTQEFHLEEGANYQFRVLAFSTATMTNMVGQGTVTRVVNHGMGQIFIAVTPVTSGNNVNVIINVEWLVPDFPPPDPVDW